MNYSWDFRAIFQFWPALIVGVGVTLKLAILSSLLGTIVGGALGVMLTPKTWVSELALLCVDAIRAIPNLVLIFFFYYFPYRQMFGSEPVNAEIAALLGLIAAQAAYSADLTRNAFLQVSRSRVLGLEALGFNRSQVGIHVKLPSIVKQVFPAHMALWIGNLKLSSLASVIGVYEVVYVAKTAMVQTFRSLEAWTTVAIIYIVLVLPLSRISRRLESHAWLTRQ
jgi:polar amino acid transport system permease protein